MDEAHDLGFAYRRTREGYTITHHGNPAATLRGAKASRFEKAVAESDFAQLQRLMTKLTGNYKRGNERNAASHPRNRR
ncbi:MAG: hypothetical protein RIC56_24130 [Pseudomonadales bacterium]